MKNNFKLGLAVPLFGLAFACKQKEADAATEVAKAEKSANCYRPNIGLQIGESIKTGWYILEKIISFLMVLWPFAVIGFLGYLGYEKIAKQ